MTAPARPYDPETLAKRTLMRPADLRRAVSEWAALGCSVEIAPDGTIKVTPGEKREDPDLIDWSRR